MHKEGHMTLFTSMTMLCVGLTILQGMFLTFKLNVGISGNVLWKTINPTKHCYEPE
jgi:hypothetical protein